MYRAFYIKTHRIYFTSIMMQEFDGNTDKNNVVYHDLNPSITARYIYVFYQWSGKMRYQ